MKEFYEECEKLKEDIVQIPSCSKLTKNIQEAEVETATMAKHVQRMDDLNEVRLVHINDILGRTEGGVPKHIQWTLNLGFEPV